jgi:putative MFS transporter
MNITSRIDRLTSTPMLRKILFLVGIGWLFDACDQGMVSGVLAAIGGEWTLSTGQLGLLSSIGMLGMCIGAALSGMAADKFGRRKVIMLTLLIYGIASGISAFSVNYTMLIVMRFFTGFGLGGELPAASTLVSELSPTKIRGRNVIILESFWAWGWIVASMVSYLVIPQFGWRAALLVGAVPALFAAVLRAAVPESPRYLEQIGKHEEADRIVSAMEAQAGEVVEDCVTLNDEVGEGGGKVRFAELWSRKYLSTTIVLWAIWFGINIGYYGFVLWTPTLLMAKGFTMVKSFEFTMIMCLAQLPGYASAGYLVERIGRKPVLVIYFLGTAVASGLFGNAATIGQVITFGCLLYFFSLGAWGCVYAYTPEVYPTRVRGTGCGWASAFGRVGAFLGALVVPVIYQAFGSSGGYGKVFIFLTIVFVAVAVVVMIFGKETKGRSLEMITE